MKKRKIFIIILLIFIVAMSAYFLVNEIEPLKNDIHSEQKTARSEDYSKKIISTPDSGLPQKNKKPTDRIDKDPTQQNIQKEYLRTIVYYFHNTARDATCRTIERLTSQSLYTYFRNQLASGKLIWKSVNMEDPWNKHFVDDFNIKHRSVVVVVPSANRQIRWKVLDNTENLVNDRTRFMNYIQNEVSPYLWGK